MKWMSTWVYVWLLALATCHAGQAQQQKEARGTQRLDDISDVRSKDILTLMKDIKAIAEQQQQIIDQLNDLKRLLPANAAPLAIQPPAILSVHGETFRGDSGARVAIVEYADFECPYCGQHARQVSPQIVESYIKTGKVKLFFRDLPLPMHPHALAAARAAHCAGEQGKYWEMHDSLFAKQTGLSDPALLDRAKTLGLDANKFSDCFSSDKYSDDLRKSMAEAQRMGIDGTPTFFIGTIGSADDVVKISKRIVGARPYETFQSALDEVLAPKSPEPVSAR